MSDFAKRYEEFLAELEFQLRISEVANTSRISITKDQGYLVLAMMQLIKENGIYVPNNEGEENVG